MCQGHLERKKEISFKREITQFLYDGIRTNSLGTKIEEIMTYRLWNRGICLVSAMVYLQTSDSQKLTMQKT
jgi:hypothetical protein